MNIRKYKPADLEIILSWYTREQVQQEILSDALCEDGTFILEFDGMPIMCLTVLLTQSKQVAYLFNFIKNSKFEDINLEQYGKVLWDHCFHYAKELGYKRVLCFASIPQLKEKYLRFGMQISSPNLTGFVKEL